MINDILFTWFLVLGIVAFILSIIFFIELISIILRDDTLESPDWVDKRNVEIAKEIKTGRTWL